ncbi:MAG: pyridoxal phosphate-dependent aminotransferase [Candidatus Njordarchaeia archaeon]
MFSNRVLDMKAPPIYELMEMAKEYKDTIFLNLGEPEYDTPEFIKNAAIKALKGGKTKYTGSMGLVEFRETIAEYESEYIKKDLTYENVIVVGGGTLALAAVLLSLADKGDDVLVLDPWWPGHPRCVVLADAKPISVPLDEENGYDLDLERIENSITQKTKAIIMVNPNNPTGSLFTKEKLKALYELASAKNITIIADETYDRIVYEEKFMSMGEIADNLDNVVIIRSFSKNFAMTGWRIGYIIASKERIKGLQKMTLALSLSPLSISQYAAMEALTNKEEAEKAVKGMVRGYKEKRDIVVKHLDRMGIFKFVKPKGAFYIFPRYNVPKMMPIDFTKYILKKSHVLVTPGYLYFGYSGKSHIRISYSGPKDQVKEGMERMEKAVEEL